MMERWNIETGQAVENEAIDKFLQEVVSICSKYGFSISHEDTHGAFVIEAYDQAKAEWLMNALVGREVRY
ncbi:MAG TPA: hypothetical protein PKE64_20510 [Anaerolineae bacterium]|nr:hypothetical protein [Anaerolineae bacterium]HMR66401.1 hypothetical protein [Anaerolineae bacterium]